MQMKRNGLSLPLDKFQIASWVLLAYNSFCCFFWGIPNLECSLVYFCSYCTCLAVTLVLGLTCTALDPVDKFSKKFCEIEGAFESQIYCSVCNMVVSESTKHCFNCKKCVLSYDHHCRFINNCVGKVNYKCFFCLIVSLEVYLAFSVLVGCFLVYRSFERDLEFSKEVVYLFWGFNFLFCCIALFSNTYLIIFHVFLKLHRMTTFDYNQRKKAGKATRKTELTTINIEPK